MKPSQISNTAAFIAVKFYGLTRLKEFRSLFDEDIIHYYEKVVKTLPFPVRSYHALLSNKLARQFFIFWEELLLPGDLMHILMRKWYLQKMVTHTHGQGFEQLVVLGAGFDHLACFQSQHGITALECNAPRMAAVKRKFIAENNYGNPNLTICDAFFSRDSLQQILRGQSQIKPNKKTMIVAEGFFDYLEPATASSAMNDIKAFFTGPLILFNTIFALQELSGFRSFVYKKSIKLAGEQLKLGMNKKAYCRFLNRHGFTINTCISYKQMEKEMIQPRGIDLPVLPGFYLLEAEYQNGADSHNQQSSRPC